MHMIPAGGFDVLSLPGGWTEYGAEPAVSIQDEGVRRTICDIVLLIFHLALSSFTFDGSISMAQKILDRNLRRDPNGKQASSSGGEVSVSDPRARRRVLPIRWWTTSSLSQSTPQGNQILYQSTPVTIPVLESAPYLLPGDLDCKLLPVGHPCIWLKACYSYGIAVYLLEIGGKENVMEASKLTEKVPEIPGKSIPLEKFVARKARKFQSQGRLTLPVLELAYLFLGIAHALRAIVVAKMLPEYENGMEFYDDLALRAFWRGFIVAILHIWIGTLSSTRTKIVSKPTAIASTKAAFETVSANGLKNNLEHHLVYHAHYELDRSLSRESDDTAARGQFHLVLSGKPLEATTHGGRANVVWRWVSY
ncbi:hypothetical protein PILCRDRAFT_15510 [Piloderma croceum F 1598]|uniref:Uncharacterized protein n=1 Tax=Piloderma croceum (strain F 1598) TaxID=765440 RepID=A0A0C3EYX9_PILCF|nr:hypothetical protein PILCRDRAFT_15510 [Piloderma croceum F 1598]